MEKFYNLLKYLIQKNDVKKVNNTISLIVDFTQANPVETGEEAEWLWKIIELEEEWWKRG